MKPNWTRRRFVGVGPGVAASSLAASRRASGGAPEHEAPAQADAGGRALPRLIYYNDAHHFHAKRQETYRREDKRYFLQPAEGAGTFTGPPPNRVLPLELMEGEWVSLTLQVADDLKQAARDGELRRPRLTLRLQNFPVEDKIRIRFNGRLLPLEEFEVTDERALRIPVRLRRPIGAPSGFAAHWLRTKLDPDLLKPGENTIEILAAKLTPTAAWARFVSGVEIRTRYRSFARPEGIAGGDRIEPS